MAQWGRHAHNQPGRKHNHRDGAGDVMRGEWSAVTSLSEAATVPQEKYRERGR